LGFTSGQETPVQAYLGLMDLVLPNSRPEYPIKAFMDEPLMDE
jgi:hypothetical protein